MAVYDVVPSASVFVWSFRDSPPAAGVGAEGGVDRKLACTLPRWATPVHQIHPSLLGTAGDVASVGHANMVAATAPPDGTATLTPVTSTAAVPNCTPPLLPRSTKSSSTCCCVGSSTVRASLRLPDVVIMMAPRPGVPPACCERDEAGLQPPRRDVAVARRDDVSGTGACRRLRRVDANTSKAL